MKQLPINRPSSEKTRTRAAQCAMALISLSYSPLSPALTAPTGWTSTHPTSRPRRRTYSTTPALSCTGVVLAMANTAV